MGTLHYSTAPAFPTHSCLFHSSHKEHFLVFHYPGSSSWGIHRLFFPQGSSSKSLSHISVQPSNFTPQLKVTSSGKCNPLHTICCLCPLTLGLFLRKTQSTDLGERHNTVIKFTNPEIREQIFGFQIGHTQATYNWVIIVSSKPSISHILITSLAL